MIRGYDPEGAGRDRIHPERIARRSVSKALDRLRRIKVGEMRVGDTAMLQAT